MTCIQGVAETWVIGLRERDECPAYVPCVVQYGIVHVRQGKMVISSGVLGGGIRGYTPYTNLQGFFDSVYSPQ